MYVCMYVFMYLCIYVYSHIKKPQKGKFKFLM